MVEISRPIATGRTAEIFPWEEGKVLKLYRSQFPRAWVDYEARVTGAAHAAGAPAPAVLGTIEAGDRYGILFERIQGSSLLASILRNPHRIGQYGRIMAELQAGIHALSADGLPDLRERLSRSISQAQGLTTVQRASVLRALDARPLGQSICHMDFHPDNILITQAGPRIIDWPNVCAGNPWADVTRTYLMLTIGDPPPGTAFPQILILARDWLRRSYLNRYLAIHPDEDHELAAWKPIIAAARLDDNIPGEQTKLLAIVQEAFGP